MKKIINGKLYDTSTARKVAEYDNGLVGDFCYTCEELYVKRTGEFFLHGEGGATSKYSHQIDSHNRAGGEDIHPMTYAEAQAWAETHVTADKYQEIFGDIHDDDDTTAVMSLSLPKHVADLARRNASIAGKTLSAYITDLISQ